MAAETYNEAVILDEPEAPRLRPIRVLVGWVVAGASLSVAAWLLPGVDLEQTGAAWIAAAAIAVLNAILPRCRRRCDCRTWSPSASSSSCWPTRFLLLLVAAAAADDIHVDGLGDALLAALAF